MCYCVCVGSSSSPIIFLLVVFVCLGFGCVIVLGGFCKGRLCFDVILC